VIRETHYGLPVWRGEWVDAEDAAQEAALAILECHGDRAAAASRVKIRLRSNYRAAEYYAAREQGDAGEHKDLDALIDLCTVLHRRGFTAQEIEWLRNNDAPRFGRYHGRVYRAVESEAP
jgi:hypothetical protein